MAAYKKVAKLVPTDPKSRAALASVESTYFNAMLLALDRRYVHRVRLVTGKDGNPLNEVELLSSSLMNHGGILRGNNVINYVPEEAVVGLELGDPIRLTADQFDRLSKAFFSELERKFREQAPEAMMRGRLDWQCSSWTKEER